MARTTAVMEKPAPRPSPSRRRTSSPGVSRTGPSVRQHGSTGILRAASARQPACRSRRRSCRAKSRITGSGRCKIRCSPSQTARRCKSRPAGGMGSVSSPRDRSLDAIGVRVSPDTSLPGKSRRVTKGQAGGSVASRRKNHLGSGIGPASSCAHHKPMSWRGRPQSAATSAACSTSSSSISPCSTSRRAAAVIART